MSPGGLLSTGTGATDGAAEAEPEGDAGVEAEGDGVVGAPAVALELGSAPEGVLVVPLQALTAASTAIETARAGRRRDFREGEMFIPAAWGAVDETSVRVGGGTAMAVGRLGVVGGHERSAYELEAFDIRVRALGGSSSALDQTVGVEREGSTGWERERLAVALHLGVEAQQQARRDIGHLGEGPSRLGHQRCRVARVADRHDVEGRASDRVDDVAETSLSK